MVERGRAFIESARVPGIPEALEVEVMTKLVAQSAQEGSVRSYLFLHRRFHPHADQNGVGFVIAKKLNGRSLSDAQRPGGENPHIAMFYLIEIGGGIQKFSRDSQNLIASTCLHASFNGGSYSTQSVVLG